MNKKEESEYLKIERARTARQILIALLPELGDNWTIGEKGIFSKGKVRVRAYYDMFWKSIVVSGAYPFRDSRYKCSRGLRTVAFNRRGVVKRLKYLLKECTVNMEQRIALSRYKRDREETEVQAYKEIKPLVDKACRIHKKRLTVQTVSHDLVHVVYNLRIEGLEEWDLKEILRIIAGMNANK